MRLGILLYHIKIIKKILKFNKHKSKIRTCLLENQALIH